MVRGCLVNGKDSCAATYYMTLTGCNNSIPTTIVHPPPKGRYFGAVKAGNVMERFIATTALFKLPQTRYLCKLCILEEARKQAECCK